MVAFDGSCGLTSSAGNSLPKQSAMKNGKNPWVPSSGSVLTSTAIQLHEPLLHDGSPVVVAQSQRGGPVVDVVEVHSGGVGLVREQPVFVVSPSVVPQKGG